MHVGVGVSDVIDVGVGDVVDVCVGVCAAMNVFVGVSNGFSCIMTVVNSDLSLTVI